MIASRLKPPIGCSERFFSGFSSWREQEHYVFEVFSLQPASHFEVSAGIGEGLTPRSNPLTVKMIVGYSWERGELEAATVSSMAHRAQAAAFRVQ